MVWPMGHLNEVDNKEKDNYDDAYDDDDDDDDDE